MGRTSQYASVHRERSEKCLRCPPQPTVNLSCIWVCILTLTVLAILPLECTGQQL